MIKKLQDWTVTISKRDGRNRLLIHRQRNFTDPNKILKYLNELVHEIPEYSHVIIEPTVKQAFIPLDPDIMRSRQCTICAQPTIFDNRPLYRIGYILDQRFDNKPFAVVHELCWVNAHHLLNIRDDYPYVFQFIKTEK